MRKSFLLIAIASAIAVSVAACGPENVSHDTLEASRTKSKENATWNAMQYRATADLANYSISASTDSIMSVSCPQGDGWASVQLLNNDNPNIKIGLKCSTLSGDIGCLPDADFKLKTYASDDVTCQTTDKVPFPLPTLKK